jgi:hypothetical protein
MSPPRQTIFHGFCRRNIKGRHLRPSVMCKLKVKQNQVLNWVIKKLSHCHFWNIYFSSHFNMMLNSLKLKILWHKESTENALLQFLNALGFDGVGHTCSKCLYWRPSGLNFALKDGILSPNVTFVSRLYNHVHFVLCIFEICHIYTAHPQEVWMRHSCLG